MSQSFGSFLFSGTFEPYFCENSGDCDKCQKRRRRLECFGDKMSKEVTLKSLFANTKTTENGCIEWQGSKNHKGYGRKRYHGKPWGTARLVMFFLGYDIEDKMVCHKCDNPPCMNPDHLFIGTAKDNAIDACQKGRMYPVGTSGIFKIQIEHGTTTMYRRGCRCDKCKKASRDSCKRYRAKKKAERNKG